MYVPPALGNVSRAFESNGAWLSRELRCSCFVGAKEFSLSTTGCGGYSVNAADAFAAAPAAVDAAAAAANELETLSALNCSINQAILAQGTCRSVSQHTRHATTLFPLSPCLFCRTDHAGAFSACVGGWDDASDGDRATKASTMQQSAYADTPPPPAAPPAHFTDLDFVFGRHLPVADPPRVAVLLTGNLRNFLAPKKNVCPNSTQFTPTPCNRPHHSLRTECPFCRITA